MSIRPPVRRIAVVIVLAAALATAVFLSGGVVASEWNWCLLAIGLASSFYFGFATYSSPRLDRLTKALLAIIGVVAIVQIIPLPFTLVAHLSPVRADLARAVAQVTDRTPAFITLSAVPLETAQTVLTLAGYGMLFLVMRDLAAREELKFIAVWPLLVIAAFESGLGMM